MSSTARPAPEKVTASRANGRPSIRFARLHWESHVFNSVRQGARTLMILVPAGSAVRAGSTVALLAAVLLAVILIVSVAWAAIWSGDPERRKDALAVLDRLLWWKGR
jgi:hypothetical protein